MNHPQALQAGTQIGHYDVREALWITNSGFSYLAFDRLREREVVIQEFLPPSLAVRHWSGIHVMPGEGHENEFEEGLTHFLREARVLAQIHDPYVCRVYEYTEANATAYLVMDYEPGQTLKDYLDRSTGALPDDELRKLLIPLLKGLRVAHSVELLHRDINPGNIYLREVGPPVLLGFGSPLIVPMDASRQHVESRVAPGYSPIEQYQTDGEVGPWSDLYSLGATMYRCLTGTTPTDATKRVTTIAQGGEDPLVPAVDMGRGDYASHLLSAIDWMLEPMPSDRPQSASAALGPVGGQPSPRSQTVAHRKNGEGETVQAPVKRFPEQKVARMNHPRKPRAPEGLKSPVRIEPSLTAAKPSEGRRRPTPDNGRHQERAKSSTTKRLLAVFAAVASIFVVGYLAVFIGTEEPKPGKSKDPAETSEIPQGVEFALPVEEEEIVPPELPENIQFTREEDVSRADDFRELERRTDQIEELIAVAEARLKQGDLVSPEGQSALTSYREILELEPENARAKLGIAGIQNSFVKLAEEAFEQDRRQESLAFLNRAAAIQDETNGGRRLRQRIADQEEEEARLKALEEERKRQAELEAQRAEQERQNKINSLMSKAATAIEQDRLTQPAGDNALAYFRQVLRLDGEHPGALEGIDRIGSTFLDRAVEALANDNLNQAEGYINLAAAILPENESAPLLRKQLETRRAAIVQRQVETEQRIREEQEARERQARLLALEQEAAAPQALPQPETVNPEITARPAPATGTVATPEPEADDTLVLQGVSAYYKGDYPGAFRILNPLAELGDARAKMRVAMMYYNGRGVSQDEAVAQSIVREALVEIRRLAESGVAWAQADLGTIFERGIVLPENDQAAVRWYTLAAEQGYAGAQTNLGVMYANGTGVSKSRENAVLWLTRAAAQGDEIARRNLERLGADTQSAEPQITR